MYTKTLMNRKLIPNWDFSDKDNRQVGSEHKSCIYMICRNTTELYCDFTPSSVLYEDKQC